MPDVDTDLLDELTIPDLAARMDRGELSSAELTELYRERIRLRDPELRAVLAADPTAPAQAQASDRRRRAGRVLGPLDGIPVLVKDNIEAIGLPCTAGSRALLSGGPGRDAELTRRLRTAGAVLLGSTNLSEWANFRSRAATSGWSGVAGQTRNPHVLDRNPSGSSSGSAAAVAAGFAQVAIGTETDGSVVSPAGACGVVGIKPSLGLISQAGIVPVTARQDTAGPIARHLLDAAVTLAVLAGAAPFDGVVDGLAGVRIGVWRLAGVDTGVDQVMRDAVTALGATGARLVDVELSHQDEMGRAEFEAMHTEFRSALERYLRTRPGAPRTLAELIAFNEADPVELSAFGQDIFERAATAPALSDPGYRAARRRATELACDALDGTFARHDLELIVAPTNVPAWPIDYAAGDAERLSSSSPSAVAGYPNITVPAGFVGPLPVGLSLLGPAGSDRRLVALAGTVESVLRARRPPRFLPGHDPR